MTSTLSLRARLQLSLVAVLTAVLTLSACHLIMIRTPGGPANSQQDAALKRSHELEAEARTAETAGDHEGALEKFEGAIAALQPAYPAESSAVTAQLLNAAEIALDKLRDSKRAEAYLSRVVVPAPRPASVQGTSSNPVSQYLAMTAMPGLMGDAFLHVRRASLLSKLGKIEESDQAIALADRLVAQISEAMDPYGSTKQMILQQEADIYIARGDHQRALSLLDSGPTNVFTLLKTSRLRYHGGDIKGTIEDIELSAAGLDADLQRVYSGKHRGDPNMLASMVGMMVMQQGQSLAVAIANPSEPRARSAALWTSAMTQGRAFDARSYERASWFGDREEKLASELRDVRAELAAKYFASLDANGKGRLDPALTKQIDELEVSMREKGNFNPAPPRSAAEARATVKIFMAAAPRAEFPRGGLELFTRAVDAAMKPGEALVDFVLFAPTEMMDAANLVASGTGEQHYIALIARKGSMSPDLVDLGSADAIDALVYPLLSALRDPRSSLTQLQQDSGVLHTALWKPLQPSLVGVTSVRVVGEGALQILPFAALYDASGAKWLAESTGISYLNSVRDLLPVEGRASGASGRSLVLANPAPPADRYTFAPLGAAHYPPLSGVAREAKVVSGILGATVLEGAAVNEANLRAVRRPQILHIASHAVFLPPIGELHDAGATRGMQATSENASPVDVGAGASSSAPQVVGDEDWMRASLVLGPPSATKGEGHTCCDSFATAYELAALDLHGTQMVTLSACETGVGKVFRQHGVTSLRRALTMAGAASVVASLWQVADDSTVVLMEAFYRELRAGKPRDVALESAMAVVRTRQPHPFYWAPFTLSGATGPLAAEPATTVKVR